MDNHSQKVMIIDDCQTDRFIFCQHFKNSELPYEIIEADSAIHALDILTHDLSDEADIPEYIFLDINMAPLDGFEFLEIFSQLQHTHHYRSHVVIASSVIDEKDKKRAFEFDCVIGFYTKPLTPDILIHIIEGMRKKNVS